ncbi:hypothetical protein GCM10010468_74460 [Actinocorallia longicatena]|uniref:Uncharacterized protein n=1 Tax=Actinocorallia longicatena TaxID=111803 RepID=A0ABP6QM87_9ACTN
MTTASAVEASVGAGGGAALCAFRGELEVGQTAAQAEAPTASAPAPNRNRRLSVKGALQWGIRGDREETLPTLQALGIPNLPRQLMLVSRSCSHVRLIPH